MDEKQIRLKDYCVKELRRVAIEGTKDDMIRFCAIEYLSHMHKQNPYEIAKELRDVYGYVILFDDTAISREENKKKHKKLYGDVPMKSLRWTRDGEKYHYYVVDIK